MHACIRTYISSQCVITFFSHLIIEVEEEDIRGGVGDRLPAHTHTYTQNHKFTFNWHDLIDEVEEDIRGGVADRYQW